jgi:hypothetical protein
MHRYLCCMRSPCFKGKLPHDALANYDQPAEVSAASSCSETEATGRSHGWCNIRSGISTIAEADQRRIGSSAVIHVVLLISWFNLHSSNRRRRLNQYHLEPLVHPRPLPNFQTLLQPDTTSPQTQLLFFLIPVSAHSTHLVTGH